MIPPKPEVRADRVSLWRYARLFRQDILSAQPARLYRAWMAEFRTPFFRSYLVNQPDLVKRVLRERPGDFPKSDRIGAGLRPLLGRSVFLTNGAEWQRQRRIIDPAFEGGRLRETYPAIWQAAEAARARLAEQVAAGGAGAGPSGTGAGQAAGGSGAGVGGTGAEQAAGGAARGAAPEAAPGAVIEVEVLASHAAADVIFRTLFSIPIEDALAQAVFHEFRAYQRSQPILNLAAFLPGPRWMPRFFRRQTRASATRIRALITGLTEARQAEIAAGTAPDDLATKIMTTRDPLSGERFSAAEMVDQVAIFFLAGHETSASALGWALYLLATHPEWQEQVAEEAQGASGDFASLARLGVTRDVFRETLRLYPPVPMMVRETTRPERFRDRDLAPGAQVVLSPWHLHRHERLWDRPDHFDPARWQSENGKRCAREAYIPFSAGARVCTGAGFAMAEGVALLAALLRDFRVAAVPGRVPVPEAHLTVRAREGIWLRVTPR